MMRTTKIKKRRIMKLVSNITKIKILKRMTLDQANKASQNYINQPQMIS